MSTMPDPYPNAKVAPGDLITAELFNGLQASIKKDIAAQIKAAVEAIKNVDKSGDSDKLGGKTPKELEEEIIQRALAEIPKRTGYQMIFKRLEKDKPEIINHNLKVFPLVDAYQLDYFEVVCADGEEKENKFVNFYLYHSDETEQKSATPGEKRKLIIESSEDDQFVFKIEFAKMLDVIGVKYTQSQSLGDVVTEFWQKLFSKPNDKFDVDQYCNSFWFEKCCGDNRSISTLMQRGDWNNLRFQMRARKTINLPSPLTVPVESPVLFPNNLEVVHLDFDNIGVKLLRDPHYSTELVPPNDGEPKIKKNELKVMFLLKV